LRSPDGSHPYSVNPDDYAALCRKCHIAFDTEHDPVYAERRRVGTANGRAVRVQCGECDLTSNTGGLSNHQKWSKHKGRKELGS
jgi:hypothetical protein